MIFEDRYEAGKRLAEKLKHLKNCVVLSIPRGGVVVGVRIAEKLKCPHSIVVARKMGAPNNPELAIGAVTADGELFLDDVLIKKLGVNSEYIVREQEYQMQEAARREELYKVDSGGKNLNGKVVVLVDDGLATGATMEAAIRSVKRSKAKEVVVAVPVAPAETVERFKKMVNKVVVLETPETFWSIGEFYSRFPQVTDLEVIKILKKAG